MTAAPLLPDLSRLQKRRKAWAGLSLVVFAATVAVTGSAWPASGLARSLIQDLGLALIGVAVVGRGWCSLYIGGRKAHDLVTEGPYSLCRNPLYLFSFAGVFGAGAQTGSLVLAVLCLLAAIAVFLPVVRTEERWLLTTHGEGFETYVRDTPRFLPNPKLWRSASQITVRPDLFVRTLADAVPFILAWPLFGALARLHDSVFSPLIRLP